MFRKKHKPGIWLCEKKLAYCSPPCFKTSTCLFFRSLRLSPSGCHHVIAPIRFLQVNIILRVNFATLGQILHKGSTIAELKWVCRDVWVPWEFIHKFIRHFSSTCSWAHLWPQCFWVKSVWNVCLQGAHTGCGVRKNFWGWEFKVRATNLANKHLHSTKTREATCFRSWVVKIPKICP